MMNYHSRDKKKGKFKTFAILILVIILFYSGIVKTFFGMFGFLFYPVWSIENNVSENYLNPFSFLEGKKQLLIENKILQEKNDKTNVLIANNSLLLKENVELKEILGRSKSPDDFVLASVLNSPNISEYDSLIIDAGKKTGIKKKDKVYAWGNILIGEVSEVSKKTSKIKLYSSSGEEIKVLIGLYNLKATALGKGAGNFQVKVPRGSYVRVGDSISSVGLNAPVFGFVEEIESDIRDSFKTIFFKSPINLFELKWVQIQKTE